MRRWLEEFEEFAIDVILDRRHGKRAAILRAVLKALSHLYKAIVLMRLWLFRKRILRQRQVGCMVISIGNLTVGGTGKTPVVEKFARALQTGGRRVAILSRGYKSKKLPLLKRLVQKFRTHEYKPRIVSDGHSILLDSRMAGDEPYMLATNLKDVVVLVDKNRVASALYAIDKMNCDTLLLDDGMQFIHLKHRIEIVLVDRQAPFGNEHLLPRGTLREPPQNLKRANYIFITKSTPEGNIELIKRIRLYNRTAEIIECAHRPQYLEHVHTGERLPLDYLQGKYIGVFSAIASPESFERSLCELGSKIEISKHFADHHRFTDKELQNFMNRCVNRDLDAIITTEKDSVRLPRLDKWE
ncbi:MAG: tetraacyldisaccharide 4'-kinase, partial [Verrucomicrobiota bacterium]